MADCSYNYNPSYHPYTYGLVYPPGPEKSHGGLPGWADPGVGDLSPYAGLTQAYYTAAARSHEQPQRGSPEQHCHYPGSGALYRGHRADTQGHDPRQDASDSASDSETNASPDSWSSGSSGDGRLPQADPTAWVKNDAEVEVSSRSPDASEVSSSLLEEPNTHTPIGNEGITNITPLEITAPSKKPSTSTSNTPKAKARAAFSESQMNTLVQRFSVQRYLTPAEMKNLAEVTGITYKQVKTWFQNRRTKLRKHQKETSWASERDNANRGSPGPIHGPIMGNIQSHIPPYPTEARPQHKEHYNQHMMEAALKKTTSQNLAFYLAAMGPAAGAGGYSSWSSGPAQAAGPARPQVNSWSMRPSVIHYDYNPSAFNMASATSANRHDINFESKEEQAIGQSALSPAHDIAQ